MPNPYADGNFAWYWYEFWIPVIVAAVSLGLLIYVWRTSGPGVQSTILRVVGTVAFLGTLPMSQERLGIGVNVLETNMFVLNILGFAVAAVNGYVHMRGGSAFGITGGEVATDPELVEPVGDVDESTVDDMNATVTQMVDVDSDTPSEGTIVPGVETAQPQAFLLVKSGPQAGTSIPITDQETVIGRSSDADVVLDDEQVSRVHANITFADGQFTMVDAGSSTGTIVDGAVGETVVLEPGAEMKLGNTEIVFMQGQSTIVESSSSDATQSGGTSDPGATIVAEPEPDLVMQWLAVTDGPSKGSTIQLRSGRTTVGREASNDLQISDATVSREHAAILVSSNGIKVIDLGSSAGSSVAGQPVAGGKVTANDVITIGQNTMALVPVDASQESAPATAGASDATMIMEAPTGGISAVIVVQSGPDAGKSFQLTEGDNLIGRDPASQVLVTDQSTSRRHAMLRKRDDAYAIYDLESSGGTKINDVAVEGTDVTPGQELKFGNSTAVIMDPSVSS